MPVDRSQLRVELHHFYDFTDKAVLYVGAGGGQLFDPACPVKRLIAVDENADVDQLKGTLHAAEVIRTTFADVEASADVVYFEFCLHEMTDPHQSLRHARELAQEVLIFDHVSGSEWSFYAAEDEEVRRAADAIERFQVRRRKMLQFEQRFQNYEELFQKLKGQGSTAVGRIQHFRDMPDIVIPMRCHLTLL